MAVNSQMLPLGTIAPGFSLPDTDGKVVSLSPASSKRPALVMFICNHCPYVKHVAAELAQIGRDYQDRVDIYAINSNDADKYPDDGPTLMVKEKAERGYVFPYLYDASQAVARAYRAACTPDLYLFDADRRLIYRGQLDDSRPRNDAPVNGRDLRAALEATLNDRPVNPDQRPSIGCNVKWKPGNEPDYFG